MDYLNSNHFQICIPGCEPVDNRMDSRLAPAKNKNSAPVKAKAQKVRLLANLIVYQRKILIEDFYTIGMVAMDRRKETIKQFEKRYLKYTSLG